jgi:4-amino-4-deoxy-L-arabinose transferase-like glycosyltransferase
LGGILLTTEKKQTESKQNILRPKQKIKWTHSLFILFIVASVFLAAKPLMNDFLNGDEWHVYNLAKTIVETGQLENEWNFLYDKPDFPYRQETPTSIYLAAWFKIFGEHVIVAHLSSFLIATLFIILFFAFAKKNFNTVIALASTAYFCTTPFFIFQSIYIRGYIHILLISLIIYYISTKIYNEKINKKTWFWIIFALFLIYLAKDIRIFSIMLVLPLLLAFSLRIYRDKIKQKLPQKIIRDAGIFIVSVLILAIIFNKVTITIIKFIFPASKSAIKEDVRFSLVALERSLLNIPITLFLLSLIFVLSFLFFNYLRKRELNKKDRTAVFLFTVLIIFQLLYGFLAKENTIIPRYTIFLMPLNIILIFYFLYHFLSNKIKKEKIVLSIMIIIAFFFNLNLWKSSIINGWSSGYNYIDMYNENQTTSKGRIKEKTNMLYEILKKDFENYPDKNIALISEYNNSPENKKISQYKDRIDIYNYRLIDIDYSSGIYQYNRDMYWVNENQRPIKEETIREIIEKYDLTYIIYQTRKEYKFMKQRAYPVLNEFERISGMNIDNSGIEIYRHIKTDE